VGLCQGDHEYHRPQGTGRPDAPCPNPQKIRKKKGEFISVHEFFEFTGLKEVIVPLSILTEIFKYSI
jgi:hypothetical protein